MEASRREGGRTCLYFNPDLMSGKGVFTGMCAPSHPTGLSGLGVRISWQFVGPLSGAPARGVLATEDQATVQEHAYVLAHVPGPTRVSDMGV